MEEEEEKQSKLSWNSIISFWRERGRSSKESSRTGGEGSSSRLRESEEGKDKKLSSKPSLDSGFSGKGNSKISGVSAGRFSWGRKGFDSSGRNNGLGCNGLSSISLDSWFHFLFFFYSFLFDLDFDFDLALDLYLWL